MAFKLKFECLASEAIPYFLVVSQKRMFLSKKMTDVNCNVEESRTIGLDFNGFAIRHREIGEKLLLS